MNIHTAAAPITAVAIQPGMMSDRLAVKVPITDFLEAKLRIKKKSGMRELWALFKLRAAEHHH
jgi:hypothetical protein